MNHSAEESPEHFAAEIVQAEFLSGVAAVYKCVKVVALGELWLERVAPVLSVEMEAYDHVRMELLIDEAGPVPDLADPVEKKVGFRLRILLGKGFRRSCLSRGRVLGCPWQEVFRAKGRARARLRSDEGDLGAHL